MSFEEHFKWWIPCNTCTRMRLVPGSAPAPVFHSGFALLLAVVDTSVFISGHAVIKRLVDSMAAVDHPVRAPSNGPFQLRIQVVVPFKVSWPF